MLLSIGSRKWPGNPERLVLEEYILKVIVCCRVSLESLPASVSSSGRASPSLALDWNPAKPDPAKGVMMSHELSRPSLSHLVHRDHLNRHLRPSQLSSVGPYAVLGKMVVIEETAYILCTN